jgi:hypothetical protein
MWFHRLRLEAKQAGWEIILDEEYTVEYLNDLSRIPRYLLEFQARAVLRAEKGFFSTAWIGHCGGDAAPGME